MSDGKPDYGTLEPEQEAARAAKFDAWLKRHDAEVKREAAAEAWDEGYEAGSGDEAFYARGVEEDPAVPHSNPYRKEAS